MSEKDIYQILRLKHYKKLKECWTDDVDGDCIGFKLYRNTESSIVLLNRFQKKRVLPDLSTMFLFRRVKSNSVVYQ